MNATEFLKGIRSSIETEKLEWHRHSLERMFERNIWRAEILEVLEKGEVIESYFEDQPYPSGLILGIADKRALHVVAAYDSENGRAFIITAYEPDLDHFEPGYRIRRKK